MPRQSATMRANWIKRKKLILQIEAHSLFHCLRVSSMRVILAATLPVFNRMLSELGWCVKQQRLRSVTQVPVRANRFFPGVTYCQSIDLNTAFHVARPPENGKSYHAGRPVYGYHLGTTSKTPADAKRTTVVWHTAEVTLKAWVNQERLNANRFRHSLIHLRDYLNTLLSFVCTDVELLRIFLEMTNVDLLKKDSGLAYTGGIERSQRTKNV